MSANEAELRKLIEAVQAAGGTVRISQRGKTFAYGPCGVSPIPNMWMNNSGRKWQNAWHSVATRTGLRLGTWDD